MSSTKVNFRTGKDIEKAIHIIYRHNSESKAFPTGLKADPKYFIKKDQKFRFEKFTKATKANEEQRKEEINKSNSYNASIAKIKTKIDDIASRLSFENAEPTVKAVYDEFYNTTKKTKVRNILDFIDIYLKEIKGNCAYNTHKKRKHDLHYFQQFTKGRQINSSSFTAAFMQEFKSWLKQKQQTTDSRGKKRTKKALSDNSANTVIKSLKMFLGWLSTYQQIAINESYKDLKLSEKYTDNIYLTQEEFKKLVNFDFSKHPHFEKVRDRFIFQCRTGLRVSDLNRFNKNTHLVNGQIKLTQQKNDSYISIPLNDVTAPLMEKYDNIPSFADPVYNRSIKKVCKLAGLDRMIEYKENKNGLEVNTKKPLHEIISSHHAVKTFITHGIELGITPKIMAAITGKSVDVLIKNYYKYNDEKLRTESIKAFGAGAHLKVS
jgi:site-specific recombinase XerD